MENLKPDFGGWATKHGLFCADGRTITKDAFKHQDGQTVPLVWNHDHTSPENVLGYAVLEHREDGVYAKGYFNDTESGQLAKKLVKHRDITQLSICANKLRQKAGNVLHGMIREVSLVHAGANPGAFIDAVLAHNEDGECEQATIYTGEEIEINHSDESDKENTTVAENTNNDKTIKDVYESMTEEQQNVCAYLIGKAIEEHDNEEDEEVKHNVFDNDTQMEHTGLSEETVKTIFSDAKRIGSLKEAVLQHSATDDSLMHAIEDDNGKMIDYGIANIEYLFPDARKVNNIPDFIKRDMGWVTKVMQGAKHLPFSRVKSVHADITMEDARARGYVKGKKKVEEVFALLKRVTTPTTIYKKQKLDRDDWHDITDFDVVAWLKAEMRLMLDEEIARAALVGDGRIPGTDDHIPEEHIRPIWKDDEVYVVRKSVDGAAHTDADARAKQFIRATIKSRKDYKGSGNPTMFMTEDLLTDCLLLEDMNGRVIYDSVEKLKTTLRVKDIVTVPVMENLTREGTGEDVGSDFALMGIMVNMNDYAFGADKGGAVSMFDDFDIDFNQQKYLIETRCSGALIKPYSAVVIELKTAAA